MTGSDDETTVEASIDTNMPSRRPESASSTWRWLIAGFSATALFSFECAAEGVDIEILLRVFGGDCGDGGAWLTNVNS